MHYVDPHAPYEWRGEHARQLGLVVDGDKVVGRVRVDEISPSQQRPRAFAGSIAIEVSRSTFRASGWW